MVDKYAPRGGLSSKFIQTRNKLLVLIPFSLLLLLVIWNSSPLYNVISGGSAPDVVQEARARFGAAYTLQHKDSLNVQDGRNQDGGPHDSSREEILAAQYDALKGTISTQSGAGVDAHPHRRDKSREEEPAKAEEDEEEEKNEAEYSTLKPKLQRERQNQERFEEEPASHQENEEEKHDEAKLSTQLSRDRQNDEHFEEEPAQVQKHEEEKKDEAEVKIKLPTDRQNEDRFEEDEDTPANRNSEINRAVTEIFEEIKSQSLPYSTVTAGNTDSSCQGKYIYAYDLPPEFNIDLAKQCDSLFPSFNLCDFFTDSGTGKPVNTQDNGAQIFVPPNRWFNTHQYALELVSHARIKAYKCLTRDPDQASLFYIPFYAGLDVIRHNFAQESTDPNSHDELSLKLLSWLATQPSWTRRNGIDHVMVLGKISWDFRRQGTQAWGSRLLEFPEMQQVTKILIERNPWAKNDIAIPHPTFFHPRSASDIRTWLKHIRSQNRTSLVTFVGKERPGTANVRGELVKQCRARQTLKECRPECRGEDSEKCRGGCRARETWTECRFVECNGNLCQVPAFVTKAFVTSEFCMQPVGDSPTRRSVFDSLIAGCIPVLFHPMTAYVQYPWHLPGNESSWSVYISEDEVKAGRADVVEILKRVSVAERKEMRGNIIGNIIPGLLYSAPGSDVRPYRDAFDITIVQLLHRVGQLGPVSDRVAAT